MINLYIEPGLSTGAIILILVIGGIVVFAFVYIVWLMIKKFFKKKEK